MITISPSQIETFDPAFGGCERKWAFDKIDRIPRKPNKYAAAGQELDDIANAWLLDGIAPPDTPIGDAFRGGMKHLPLPRTVEVQPHAKFERNGVSYFGKLDYFSTKLEPIPPVKDESVCGGQAAGGTATLVARVGDNKSTGDLAWADEKHAALLEHRDPQWLMYGAWAAQEHGADLVQGEWIYYLRRKPYSSRKLTVSATAAELLEHFDAKIHPVSLRILQAREEPSSERPKNLQACGRYGGCPYREHCLASVSPLKRIAAMSDLSTARERLAARARNANPQPATTESALQRKLRERREALEAEKAAAEAQPAPKEEVAPKEEPPIQVVEQQMRDEPVAAESASEQQMRDEPEQVAEPSGQPPAEPAPEKPKRRGRPRGSKNKKAPTNKPTSEMEVISEKLGPDTILTHKEAYAKARSEKESALAADLRARAHAGKLDVLVRLHVAAIAAHQPPDVANAHYRSIVEQVEGER